MSAGRPTPEANREHVDRLRARADEFAARYQCDDSLWPTLPHGDMPWRDWMDFAAKVAIPLATTEDDEVEQRLMVEYRRANPHYIAACITFAHNHVAAAEQMIDEQAKLLLDLAPHLDVEGKRMLLVHAADHFDAEVDLSGGGLESTSAAALRANVREARK